MSEMVRWSRRVRRALRRPRRAASLAQLHCSCSPAYHEYGVHGPHYAAEASGR